ncbi:MAG: DnaD domain protein [Candidatus Enteromonas sp.]|nr:DnaD domain protein [Candidatus Enteromonas sp.]
MSASMPTEGFDFHYLLLEYYKKLGITENELCAILMVNHLLNQKNLWITADMLSMKMNFKTKDADALLASLVQKKLLEFVPDTTVPGGWRTSIEPLRKILWKRFGDDMARNNQNGYDKQRAKDLSEIYDFFEKKLRKTLSPFDKDAINDWLDDGYRVVQIKDALEDCLLENKKTVKSIGKRLRQMRAGDDRQREGVSPVSEDWSKDLEETIRIANVKWVNGNED